MTATKPLVKPYGSWPSPVPATALTQQSVKLAEPLITPGASYWVESRPSEQGRCVLMRRRHGQSHSEEVLPASVSVRSKAHEYGGASYLATDSDVYYVNGADQRVYHWDGQKAQALTPDGDFRFADFALDPGRQRLLAVREDHRDKRAGKCREERTELVSIPLDASQAITVLVTGHDFFSNPRVSPDGQRLSWLSWDHPHMPWDSSQCWCSTIDQDGRPGAPQQIAGFGSESVFQPQWGPDNQLLLVSDRNDWWNIYAQSPADATGTLRPIAVSDSEFATPQWVFGMSTYGFLNDQTLLACHTRAGQWQLGLIDLAEGRMEPLETPFTEISQIQCCEGRALFLASSPTTTTRLFLFDGREFRVITQSSQPLLSADQISIAEPRSFPTGSGATAHGFYYPPTHASCQGPQGEKPPLLVMCHGGPTGATETGLNLKIQYWTSRGFAVMDVNYRGSTGYGRHYREQLNHAWGVHDVEDACAAVESLITEGLVDPDRIAIRGSSAGGYTVLAALTFTERFNAGASLYGIGDLETLARDTHKFEARYLDSLVGAYPEQAELYRQRSPIHYPHQLNCPVIFFQGLDDKVVPPNQAETMVAALDAKAIPVAYVPLAGEGHGFRGAAAIKRSLEAEWSFYGQVFGFEIDAAIEPVTIRHLPPQRAKP